MLCLKDITKVMREPAHKKGHDPNIAIVKNKVCLIEIQENLSLCVCWKENLLKRRPKAKPCETGLLRQFNRITHKEMTLLCD